KSFAYLVPALAWARANGERTVVSTNTINLQEQLNGKDLPALAQALPTGAQTPTFALLKGWRNYVCLARLEQARGAAGSLFETDAAAEAPHLEDVAARHLGAQVSQVGVERLLGRLERGGRGLLPTLTRELAEREDLLSAASRDLVTKGLGEALRSARRWADELFAHLARRTESE